MISALFTIMALISGLGLYFVAPLGFVVTIFLLFPVAILSTTYYTLRMLAIQMKMVPVIPDVSFEDEDKTPVMFTTPPLPIHANWPSENLSPEEQIRQINVGALPEVLDHLPSDGSHTALFSVEGMKWAFHFKFVSLNARFSAAGSGPSPREAFSIALHVIHKQIREWHEARNSGRIYVAESNEDLVAPSLHNVLNAAQTNAHAPRVMIVDDDVDIAYALESIFKQFGCKTEVVTSPDDLHRLISFENVDFIVLDWMLSEKVRANQVVEKAVRLIDTFSDLQEKFHHKHPKVVTYSVLDRSEVNLPRNDYFEHLDHWQKPIQFSELSARTSELLEACGY